MSTEKISDDLTVRTYCALQPDVPTTIKVEHLGFPKLLQERGYDIVQLLVPPLEQQRKLKFEYTDTPLETFSKEDDLWVIDISQPAHAELFTLEVLFATDNHEDFQGTEIELKMNEDGNIVVSFKAGPYTPKFPSMFGYRTTFKTVLEPAAEGVDLKRSLPAD